MWGLCVYHSVVDAHTYCQEKASKSKTSNLYGRLVNQLANAAATSSSNSAPGSTRAQAAAAFMKFSGISGPQVESEDDPVKEEDGAPSVEVAETMLKWHAEAIGRCVEMGPASEVWVGVHKLFPSVNTHTGQSMRCLCSVCSRRLSVAHISKSLLRRKFSSNPAFVCFELSTLVHRIA
jgi:hypothetical protein